jgi:hypothetical protein
MTKNSDIVCILLGCDYWLGAGKDGGDLVGIVGMLGRQ